MANHNQRRYSLTAARALSRRAMLIGLGATPIALFAPDLLALQDAGIDPKKLKPGQFVWNPDRAPEGPVVIVVSIPDQLVTVYRNGVRIAVATCSTGRPGHATPTGTFVILQKDVNHHSSLYDDAPMPYMERLTWGGVALHAGNLPGYPASHGCVRLPKAFAQLLYTVTQLGTTVIIGDHDTVPADVLHSGVLISQHTEDMAKEAVQQAKANAQSAQPGSPDGQAVSAVISTADKKIIVYQNGVPAFEDQVTLKQPDEPFGTHVFNLTGPSDDPTKLKWMAIDLGTDAVTDLGQDNGTPAQASALLYAATMGRIDVPEATARRWAALLRPGTTLVITDRPANAESYSAPGFTIMTGGDS
jgi:L,D-transpeptidase catalytic domain